MFVVIKTTLRFLDETGTIELLTPKILMSNVEVEQNWMLNAVSTIVCIGLISIQYRHFGMEPALVILISIDRLTFICNHG